MYNDEMTKLTQIALCWELHQTNTPIVTIAQTLGVHRETVGLWITRIVNHDGKIAGFLDEYTAAHTGPRKKRKLDGLVKHYIYTIREENRDCCGQKIQVYLQRQYDIVLSLRTIYKVLGEKYHLKSRWKKNVKRGPVPKATAPRQVIQMDSVDFGYVFAFTGVDIFSKEVSVQLYPSLTSADGEQFLHHSFHTRFTHTELLQTDGGSEFKDKFKKKVFLYADRFRVSRPYRKNEQSYIESFNRSLRKECLGWGTFKSAEIPSLQREVDEYLLYYHGTRVHLGAGMKTPQQVLEDYQLMSDH